ncbi:hypothetical protein N9Z70_05110 [Mariniblastus sp.]|nr:hypothetical protein [Mariniblastus sp.]
MGIPNVDIATRVCLAFPPALADDVRAVCRLLPHHVHEPTEHDIGQITVDGMALRIPSRIYSAVPTDNDLSTITDGQRLIVSCLLTRHHNGFVRQRFAANFENTLCSWSLPFAIQLLGEYVHPICIDLLRVFPMQPDDGVGKFVADNSEYIATTRRRIISYWHYYRIQIPSFTDYAPYQILERLGVWDHTLTPRLTAR